jgi:hypothetical protein
MNEFLAAVVCSGKRSRDDTNELNEEEQLVFDRLQHAYSKTKFERSRKNLISLLRDEVARLECFSRDHIQLEATREMLKKLAPLDQLMKENAQMKDLIFSLSNEKRQLEAQLCETQRTLADTAARIAAEFEQRRHERHMAVTEQVTRVHWKFMDKLHDMKDNDLRDDWIQFVEEIRLALY